MSNIAIVTDSNSGILPAEAQSLRGVFVVPMPVLIGDETFYEGIDITQHRFYEVLSTRTDLMTSQTPGGSRSDRAYPDEQRSVRRLRSGSHAFGGL